MGLNANQRKDEPKQAVIRVDDLQGVIDRNTLSSGSTVIIAVSPSPWTSTARPFANTSTPGRSRRSAPAPGAPASSTPIGFLTDHAQARVVYDLTQRFGRLIRDRRRDDLEGWL